MGGGGSYSSKGDDQWQQPKITPQPKPAQPEQEDDVKQATRSDTNVPIDITHGTGGAIQIGGEPPLEELEVPELRDRCIIVHFKTTLSAPDAHAISSTYVGQILDVVSRGHRIEVLNAAHETCGVVILKSARMIECIEKGYRFLAQVLFKDGAELQVHIRNKVAA
jgi:hypothetical protein